MSKTWIGVDLDGTLAHYTGWNGGVIGAPIAPMVALVQKWLAEGKHVKVFTARVAAAKGRAGVVSAIEAWCAINVGRVLPVTCCKDFDMLALYDDRAVQVITNTGELVLP